MYCVSPTGFYLHQSCLFCLADICNDVPFKPNVFGCDTVIAKDVDSRRQLTEPLKGFIYAMEPTGRGRGGEEREGKVHSSRRSFEVRPSHLISVIQVHGN